MRNLKKVLALVIAFSMMLSVVAFAGYNDVDADADYAGAVELLSALDIFQGDENGNFNPDNTITRAEMAAIIIRAKGLESAANASKGATMFPDVAADHWASGYVNLASQNGIITGTDEGLFDPNGTLTYEAAVAMIVRALGFEPIAQKKGGWTAGYVVVANSYKVTEGAAANATRANLAILMANALNTPMMDQTSYGSDEKYEVLDGKNERDYRTLLTDMDIYVATGIPGEKDVDEIVFDVTEDSDCETFVAKKDDTSEETFKIGESDIALYQNQQVDAYVLKDGRDYIVKAVVASDIGETFELLSDDIADVKVGAEQDPKVDYDVVEYYVDAANSNKTKEIKVKAGATIEYNKGSEARTLANFKTEDDVELVFIENTGNSVYDYVVATSYLSDRVDYVDADKDKISLKNVGRTVEFDFEDEEATIILVDDAGKELTVADFAKDDVVAIVADSTNPARYSKYIKVVKLSNAAVTGTVDETFTSNGAEYVVINGEEYVSAYAEALEAGDEGTFYIGLTGKVIDFDGSLAGDNYAYILEGAIAQGSFSADQWQLKLLTEEDGIVTYDIKKDYHDKVVDYLYDNAKAFGLTVTADDPETKDVDETAINEDKFIFGTKATEGTLANKARLVTFEVNSNGEIKELAMAGSDVKAFAIGEDAAAYREATQKLGGATLEDDVVIFNVADANVKNAKTADISFLVDESSYTGFALKDEDGEYSAIVITALESKFSAEDGFAIVTKVSTGKDAEGEEVTKISYVQNEEEGLITLNDDSVEALKNGADLEVGDVFMFVADAEGLVSEYIIIATYDEKTKALSFADGDLAGKLKVGNEETKLVTGYIENDRRVVKSKGEIITVDGVEYVVPAAAYKYTFNTLGRNAAIEVSDFMYDAEYCELVYAEKEADLNEDGTKEKYDIPTGKAKATPVILRLVDDDVVDVYSVNDIKDITAPTALIDAWKDSVKKEVAELYK